MLNAIAYMSVSSVSSGLNSFASKEGNVTIAATITWLKPVFSREAKVYLSLLSHESSLNINFFATPMAMSERKNRIRKKGGYIPNSDEMKLSAIMVIITGK